jgi:hypothetical protein
MEKDGQTLPGLVPWSGVGIEPAEARAEEVVLRSQLIEALVERGQFGGQGPSKCA